MAYHHGALYDHVLTTLSVAPAAAGTANGAGAILDMQNWDGVEFVLSIGTFTGQAATGLTFYASASESSTFAQGTAITGGSISTAIGTASPYKQAVVDVWRPSARYIRANVVPDGGTIIYAVTAHQYGRHGVSTGAGTAVGGWGGTATEYALVQVS